MTAARPYRMTPLTPEQALTELRKFAGIQFDPVVVDAFVRTSWVDGIIETGGPPDLRAIPTIAQVAERMTDRMTKPTTVPKPRTRPRAKQT
jgi:response regulator RpfG family c-di-GMP phosphodiesterase